MKRGICFDLDGTLIDSSREGLKRIFKIAQKRSLLITPEIKQRIENMWGIEPVKLLEAIWPNENSRDFFTEWENLDLREPHLAFPGVKETLQKLSLYFYMSIVTNRRMFNTPAQLNKNGLMNLFEIIVTQDRGFKKPDPKIMEPVFRYYLSVGITRQKIIFVGDTVEGDWKLAQATNIEFFAVTCGGMDSREKFLAAGVSEDHIINSVADLPQILLK